MKRAAWPGVRGPDATTGLIIKLPSEEDLAAAAGWLHRLLTFGRAEGRWLLLEPAADHRRLIVGDTSKTLRPDETFEAQQWATGLIEGADARSVHASGCRDVVSLRVTEWRLAQVNGMYGWVPLFNITRPCLLLALGADDLVPATGSESPCLRPAAASPDQ
ncbi:hypothetical protein AB0M02_10685 [Actinoplanes sp. NPDC051861]|uniref:hypothetical protein n=1 Tax=Actinoplanes sp. NPDC051861 TaxID=3155170 RepID=UPI003444BC28